VTMHGFSACLAVGAMLFALISAPLLHVHDHDGGGHAESFVHAHFPESKDVDHSSDAVEPHHAQEHGRPIDLFAASTTESPTHHFVAEFSEPCLLGSTVLTRAVQSVQTLRTHSPPEQSDLPPRSPPIL
jgi:hypothetical protein